MNNPAINQIAIKKVSRSVVTEMPDQLAVEEPLAIQLVYSSPHGRIKKSIAITMRTPGNDLELALGFLFTEGIIAGFDQLASLQVSRSDENLVIATLKENVVPVIGNTYRNFYSSSSCGICGKASIDAIWTNLPIRETDETFGVPAELLYQLPNQLLNHQTGFEQTGGLHACALFDNNGKLLHIREDIGRHNALDKLIGTILPDNRYLLKNSILLLSGRAGFELIQKSAMAGIRMVAAIGAPSSLAAEMAFECGITLVGFMRKDRFNIYCGGQRIQL
jgi:FdhD protein